MRRSNCSASGYSLLEVLLTVSLLGLLLFAVGDVVGHVLDTTMRGEGRQNVSRSADELAFRLGEEARSSTAVYIPSVDVLGRPNMLAAGSQEVDFFRKASDGSSAFVAYHYDAPSGSVMRYEFVPEPGSTPQIIHQDEMADHVTSFTAEKMTAHAAGGVVGAGTVDPVNIYYGSHDRVGGNGIVTVTVVEGLPGEPQRRFDVHLASRAAPTDVSILVPAGSPPPSPSPSNSPISVGFLLVSPNFHPPHGPYHGGDPGDPGGGIHGPGIPGTSLFVGNGVGRTVDWMSLYDLFGSIQDGIYRFRNSEGQPVTVTIVCGEGACPSFIPLPQTTIGPNALFYTMK